jgi:hypothetical protein
MSRFTSLFKSRSTKSTRELGEGDFSFEADNPQFHNAWCNGRSVVVSKQDLQGFLRAMELDEYTENIFPLAKSRHVDENFLFLEEVKEFKKKPNLNHAIRIYDTFIDQSAAKQVNLRSDNRTNVENAIMAYTQTNDFSGDKKVDPDLFDTAAVEIIGMVIDDIIRQYCTGRQFGKKKRKSSRRTRSRLCRRRSRRT